MLTKRRRKLRKRLVGVQASANYAQASANEAINTSITSIKFEAKETARLNEGYGYYEYYTMNCYNVDIVLKIYQEKFYG